ncbi:MAG: LysR family transcriptional regulator [Deinococcus-Thermus bacterium]|jgi:DNA-binding transcriptional LysR family regulator|nr:LysR family transcriptional regulator [Deinococcota bacterium]
MEMHQIRYVLAAADWLNFTRAAASCHVSQPALTKGIKALERELGAPLFHREGRRILVSEFGRSMMPHLRQIAAEAEAAQALARNFQTLHEAPVRLGVLASLGHGRFGDFLRSFRDAHDGVELAMTEGVLAELRRALVEDEIDLAITSRLDDVDDAFALVPLYTERYVVALAPDHPLAGKESLTLEALDGYPYVDRVACEMRESLAAMCEARSVDLRTRFRSGRDDWVQAMVLAGIGVAIMPEFSVTLPGLAQRPLIDPEMSREVGIATVRGRPFSPAVTALIRLARSFDWRA